jgi:hypothetical protein
MSTRISAYVHVVQSMRCQTEVHMECGAAPMRLKNEVGIFGSTPARSPKFHKLDLSNGISDLSREKKRLFVGMRRVHLLIFSLV